MHICVGTRTIPGIQREAPEGFSDVRKTTRKPGSIWPGFHAKKTLTNSKKISILRQNQGVPKRGGKWPPNRGGFLTGQT